MMKDFFKLKFYKHPQRALRLSLLSLREKNKVHAEIAEMKENAENAK